MEELKNFQVMDNFVFCSFPKISRYSHGKSVSWYNLSNNYVKWIYFSSASSPTNFWTAAVKVRNSSNFPSVVAKAMNVLLWKQNSQDLKNTWGFTRACIWWVVINYFWAEKLTFSLMNFTAQLQWACLPLFQTRDRERCFRMLIVLKVGRLHLTLLRKNGKWLLGPKLLTETELKSQSVLLWPLEFGPKSLRRGGCRYVHALSEGLY